MLRRDDAPDRNPCSVLELLCFGESLIKDRIPDVSITERSMSCPRCGAAMNELVRIEPTLRGPGLIGYECPRCVYVTSVLLEPDKSNRGQ
jgi:transposase-like protein